VPTLSGTVRRLTWQDFPIRRAQAPAAGHHGTAATTHTSYSVGSNRVHPRAHTNPVVYELQRAFSVRNAYNRNLSFVYSWVFTRPSSFAVDLLNHEQGHYDITALICRDYYIDVIRRCGSRTFTSQNQGNSILASIRRDTLDKIPAVQRLYDSEVHPEQEANQSRGSIQLTWDGYFQKAFSLIRPREQGVTWEPTDRITLVEVLRRNGRYV
jgi:hypothetical protein